MTKPQIYILRSQQTDKIYIGSTKLKMSERMKNHRHKTNLNLSASQISNYPDFYYETLESFPHDISKFHLLSAEQRWIDRYPNAINKMKAAGSVQEKDHIMCTCGRTYSRKNKCHHLRTNIHQIRSMMLIEID